VFAACGVVVSSPLVAAAVAWRRGWMPLGDEAAAVAQSWGTLSSRPPLLGLYSTVSGVTDASQTLYHPGPMQLWLLAGPLHLFAPSNAGALFGSALLVAFTLAVLLVAAWRRGGLRRLVPSVAMVSWSTFVVGALWSAWRLVRGRQRGAAGASAEPGRLALAAKGFRAVSKNASGRAVVLVKAKGARKKKLKRRGKLRAVLKLTYTPADGAPATLRRRITLKHG
jgi:hypothetical protein